MKTTSDAVDEVRLVPRPKATFTWSHPLKPTLLFVASSLLMYLGMSEVPGPYDESITLLGAMRVAAGQLPHRDFYAIYGPILFYPLAWLYRLFGESLFIERVFFALIAGLIITEVHRLTAEYCGRSATVWTLFTVLGLHYGIGAVSGSAIIPVALLNLVITALLLPVFLRPLSLRRLLGIGLLTGLADLVRYDTGIQLLFILMCVIVFAVCLRVTGSRTRLRELSSAVGTLLLGFALVTVPALIYYLSVAPWKDFAHDMIDFPRLYYNRARGVPFPGIHSDYIVFLAVYVCLLIAFTALYVGVKGCLRLRGTDSRSSASAQWSLKWHGLLAAFSVLSLVMYIKGWVRPGPGSMYLSIVPTLVLVALLYDQHSAFQLWFGRWMQVLLGLSVLTAALIATRQVRQFDRQHLWVPAEMVAQARGRLSPLQTRWCQTPGPLTVGHCFIPDDDRIQTIEFITSHTRSTDKLFDGTTRHDKIFINDMIIYFATQRLPMTHWAHFDPLLQNTLPIQQDMVQEFQTSPPPYIVLDSEWDDTNEPNDSGKSSGVFLLDNYLRSHYRLVETHGTLSIWQRIPQA